jgi:hypothetical protein
LLEFIETYDRAGNIAYVPSKYIKVITGDMKEYLTPLAYDKYDPTDYRIEEPIPTTYPFSNYAFLKAAFVLSYGTNVKSPYAYSNSIKSRRMMPSQKMSAAHQGKRNNRKKELFYSIRMAPIWILPAMWQKNWE